MIVLTFDTDYMWEEDLLRFVEEFPFPGKATFFLWQPHRGLRLGDHELAPHPVFSEVKSWAATLDEFHTQWGRAGAVLRAHSCAYSHALGVVLAQSGYRAVSQATYPGKVGLEPHRHPWGIWELPIYYMDNMDFTLGRNWPGVDHRPFSRGLIEQSLSSEHLFVYDFHPLHVVLNSSSYDQYQTVRGKIISRKNSCFDLAFGGRGTRTFFEELVGSMESAAASSVRCSDVLERL